MNAATFHGDGIAYATTPLLFVFFTIVLAWKLGVSTPRGRQDANGPTNCSAYTFDTPTKPNDTNKNRIITVPERLRDA